MKATAFSYIRFSTTKQMKGVSLERQTERAKAICERHGWQLDTRRSVADLGRSAFKGKSQKELHAFLELVRTGQIEPGSVLIIEKLDRLSRKKVWAACQLFQDIVNAGVTIATVEPERLYTTENVNDISSVLEVVIAFALANEESEKKSDRTKYNWSKKRQKRDKPVSSLRPAWVDWNAEQERFELNQGKAAIVRRIYADAINGKGARLIAKELNEEGVVNISHDRRKTSSKTWNKTYIEAILRNRSAFGEWQPMKFVDVKEGGDVVGSKRVPDGEPWKDYYPAAIDEATFYKAQNAKASRLQQRGRPSVDIVNIFQNIAFDASTGSTMTLTSVSNQDRKAGRQRRLASYHSINGVAKTNGWEYYQLETLFLRCVHEIVEHVERSESETPSRLPELNARLQELTGNITKAQELNNGKDIAAVFELLAKLDDERKSLLAEIEDEKRRQESNTVELGNMVADVIHNGKRDRDLMERIKAATRQLVKEVQILIEPIDGNRLKKRLVGQVFLTDGGMKPFWAESWKGKVELDGIGSLETKGYSPQTEDSAQYFTKRGRHGYADLRRFPKAVATRSKS